MQVIFNCDIYFQCVTPTVFTPPFQTDGHTVLELWSRAVFLNRCETAAR